MSKKNRVIQKPDVIESNIGKLKVIAQYKVPHGLKATSGAMVQLYKADISCQRRKEIDDEDDYTLAVDKALAALDAFIQETRPKKSAGWKEVYDLSKAGDWTLLLLWQIRNVIQHSGGIVNAKCKAKYEKKYREMDQNGIKPRISLPPMVTPGEKFTFIFEDFKEVRECLFEFIERDIGKEATDILRTRSSHGEIKFTDATVFIRINGRLVGIDYKEAEEFGVKLEPGTNKLIFPKHIIFGHNKVELINFRTGETLKLRTPESVQSSKGPGIFLKKKD